MGKYIFFDKTSKYLFKLLFTIHSVIKLPADYCPNIFVCGMVLLFLDFSRPPTLYNCLLFFFSKKWSINKNSNCLFVFAEGIR